MPRSEKIILTSIQSEAAYAAIVKDGVVFGDRIFGGFTSGMPEMERAYDWMRREMARRIGRPPQGAKDPLWAWAKSGGAAAPIDLRTMPWLKSLRPYWRLDIAVPRELVLLSCYMKWHIPLNGFSFKSLNELSRRETEATWREVFRVGPTTRNIQATLWEIRAEWVTRATRHAQE